MYNSRVFEPKKKRKTKPGRYVAFDIETIGWGEPCLIGWYDGEEYRYEEGRGCVERFLGEFFKVEHTREIWFAHNGGKFDFSHILDAYVRTRSGQHVVQPLRIGSGFAQIRFERHKRTWTMRDSIKLFPFTLRKLGQNLGLETAKGDYDVKNLTWERWERDKAEIREYNLLDCRVLYEAITKQETYLIEEYGTSLRRAMTLPSVSMDAFQRNFLAGPIPTHKTASEDIRKAYFGGRVEIFKTRITDAFYYDINSLYPSVMREHKYPVSSARRSKSADIERDEGFALVEVTVPHGITPPLPVRHEGKLVFPVGKWTGWYALPELRLAVEKGCTVRVLDAWLFDTDYLFREYVDKLYAIRQQYPSGTVENTTAKLMLNSLYGKFGTKREKKQYSMNPEDVKGWTPLYEEEDFTLYEKPTELEAPYILEGIAAYVTAYARVRLYRLLDGNDPAYCDTDSIVTRSVLPVSGELGALKLEHEVHEGYFRAPKLYALSTDHGDVVRAKGFPAGTFSFATVKDAVLTGDDSALKWETRKLVGIMEGVRREGRYAVVDTLRRSVQTAYNKRIVLENGETKPLVYTPVSSDTEQ